MVKVVEPVPQPSWYPFSGDKDPVTCSHSANKYWQSQKILEKKNLETPDEKTLIVLRTKRQISLWMSVKNRQLIICSEKTLDKLALAWKLSLLLLTLVLLVGWIIYSDWDQDEEDEKWPDDFNQQLDLRRQDKKGWLKKFTTSFPVFSGQPRNFWMLYGLSMCSRVERSLMRTVIPPCVWVKCMG